jgi:hypothetical protein
VAEDGETDSSITITPAMETPEITIEDTTTIIDVEEEEEDVMIID